MDEIAMPERELEELLSAALQARQTMLDHNHHSAFRLFNGFYEGCPDLAVDIYARTLVTHNYASPYESGAELISAAQDFFLQSLPWLRCIVVKHRNAEDFSDQRGQVVYGEHPDRRVQENGVWYALDLGLNRDASLYLDTRNLRIWARQHLAGARVLNTFAYTGSLGVAAMAGGAGHVVQLDRNKGYLNLAKTSYSLNGFPIQRADFMVSDFFTGAARLKRAGQLFDCIFVDPPFYSTSPSGTIDLLHASHRVINKVRPLVAHGGWLVAINNSLYLSGQEYLKMLEDMAADGYTSIESTLPIAPDFTGYAQTVHSAPPVDPAPFNHPTKIAILRVRRKDARSSSGTT
jgi:23S rRNA (cytosine1962-C5)-methyltransferase